jgi:hypothetical protein
MKKYLKWILVLVPVSGFIALGFNNCSRMGQLGSPSGGDSFASVSGEDVQDSQALGLPIALLSAEQTLSSMMKVTNTNTASQATLNEYNTRYGALAAGNDLNMANGPLMLGSTSLAGEICNNMVTQEMAIPIAMATTRNFYGSVDFTKGVTSLTDTNYSIAIRAMARSFWGRAETTDELASLMTFKQEFIDALAANVRTQGASTKNLITATCAGMLSSVDAITY